MDVRLDRDEFARRFRMLLDASGISQYKLATELGVDRTTVTNWARGHRLPGMEQLLAICRFFEVPITHFFDEEPVEIVRFHDPELNDLWREAPEEVRRDVGLFLRFLMEKERKRTDDS